MKSITEWLLDNKIAHHWKHAENTSKLLHLGELYNAKEFDKIETRAKLYRDWRAAGEDAKTAAEKAIAGDLIPSPLFEGVLHSEKEDCKMTNWKEQIEKIRHMVDSDPSLFAFCVRDWDITEKAGLRDLAWALARDDSYATSNDAKGLLEMLEAYLDSQPTA